MEILQVKLLIALLASSLTYLICFKLTPALRGLFLGLQAGLFLGLVVSLFASLIFPFAVSLTLGISVIIIFGVIGFKTKLTKCVEFTSIIGAGTIAINVIILVNNLALMGWVYLGTIAVMAGAGIGFQRAMKFHQIDHEDERDLN